MNCFDSSLVQGDAEVRRRFVCIHPTGRAACIDSGSFVTELAQNNIIKWDRGRKIPDRQIKVMWETEHSRLLIRRGLNFRVSLSGKPST